VGQRLGVKTLVREVLALWRWVGWLIDGWVGWLVGLACYRSIPLNTNPQNNNAPHTNATNPQHTTQTRQRTRTW